MKRCSRCVLPDTYPGIEFDAEGVCNYCLSHQDWEYEGEEALRNLFEKGRRSDSEYDCVVGVSGGRDSSYMLYYLVKVLGLNVVAFSGDHGFVPEIAKDNLRQMADVLGVKLVIGEHDNLKKCIRHNVEAWLRVPSPAMAPMLCNGCRIGVQRGLLDCAREYKAPFIVYGAATPVERGTLKTALFRNNPGGRSFSGNQKLSLVSGMAYEFWRNPRYLLRLRNLAVTIEEYMLFFQFRFVLRVIAPGIRTVEFYRYIEWNEDTILSTIKSELNWRQDSRSTSSWRFDCALPFLKNYLLKDRVGATEKEDGLSQMVREGMITREMALDRLESETVIPEEVIRELARDIGMDGAFKDFSAH